VVFVTDVRRLREMKFIEQAPKTASLTFDERGTRYEMEEPDDEAVRAAITQFRQIYTPSEPHSFNRTMKLLKRTIHECDGPDREEALALFDGHIDAAKEALGTVGIGISFERPDGVEDMTPERIIDAYMHGHYLHGGNKLTELAKQLDALQPWPRYTLYSVMYALTAVYWNAANATDIVLNTPELLDA
jgi:hypothetical protein